MALAAWKRLERTPGYQRGKLALKRLVGRELRLRPDLAVSTLSAGGWQFHPDALGSDSIVYSFGVGDDIEFDLDLIRRFGLAVHAFDPTPSTIEWLAERSLPSGFRFHPWAVAAADGLLTLYPRVRRDGSLSDTMYTAVAEEASRAAGVNVPAFTVATIARMLGHRHIDLLKMDVEGAEYDVLDRMLSSAVRPRQLLVEFHHRFADIDLGRTAGMLARLRASGYGITAVSRTGREVSLMQTAA